MLRLPEVAPHAGAWIETFFRAHSLYRLRSLPTRERGLKLTAGAWGLVPDYVAPHAGAWIETSWDIRLRRWKEVAPHAGAWIETLTYILLLMAIK